MLLTGEDEQANQREEMCPATTVAVPSRFWRGAAWQQGKCAFVARLQCKMFEDASGTGGKVAVHGWNHQADRNRRASLVTGAPSQHKTSSYAVKGLKKLNGDLEHKLVPHLCSLLVEQLRN